MNEMEGSGEGEGIVEVEERSDAQTGVCGREEVKVHAVWRRRGSCNWYLPKLYTVKT